MSSHKCWHRLGGQQPSGLSLCVPGVALVASVPSPRLRKCPLEGSRISSSCGDGSATKTPVMNISGLVKNSSGAGNIPEVGWARSLPASAMSLSMSPSLSLSLSLSLSPPALSLSPSPSASFPHPPAFVPKAFLRNSQFWQYQLFPEPSCPAAHGPHLAPEG